MTQDTVDRAKIEPVATLFGLTHHSGPAVVLCALAMIASSTLAHADTYRFSTPIGAIMAGLPVDATALFTINDGSLLITLTNNDTNPRADDQVIVDLSFQIEQDTSLGNLSLGSETAQVVDIMSSTSASSIQGPVEMNWIFAQSGIDFGLCDNPGAGNSQGICTGQKGSRWPKNGLIGYGMGADKNVYAAANGSIAGNRPHNSFYYQQADFQITGPSLTRSGVIQNVKFYFGTSSGEVAAASGGLLYDTVPEPGPATVVLIGLFVLGMTRRLRPVRATRPKRPSF